MCRYVKTLVLMLLVLVGTQRASAFSLMGPLTEWMSGEWGYGPPTAADVGGPMNLTEEYRWNTETITYAFDPSFIGYFGERGMQAVEQAFKVLADLPNFSSMSESLSEYPLTSRRTNYRAQTLRLLDMKSIVLGILLEEMGVASSDRFCFSVRNEYHETVGDQEMRYVTIAMRNFDPVTLVPTPYVNGTLYTYHIFHQGDPVHLVDAVEDLVNPIAQNYTAVSSSAIGIGTYYTGLTRDDVAALRYIYRKNNYNVENPPATVTGPASGSPWAPVGSIGLTNYVTTALRPGLDKLKFKRLDYDSLLGQTIVSETNQTYKDYYIVGGKMNTQTLNRLTTTPDFLFVASDFAFENPETAPGMALRTIAGDTATGATNAPWVNNSALNSTAAQAGPGVIQGQIVVQLNKVGPLFINVHPTTITEANSTGYVTWGSFDGSVNEPVVYPNASDMRATEAQVFKIKGVYNPPWYPALLTATTTNQAPTTDTGNTTTPTP